MQDNDEVFEQQECKALVYFVVCDALCLYDIPAVDKRTSTCLDVSHVIEINMAKDNANPKVGEYYYKDNELELMFESVD